MSRRGKEEGSGSSARILCKVEKCCNVQSVLSLRKTKAFDLSVCVVETAVWPGWELYV